METKLDASAGSRFLFGLLLLCLTSTASAQSSPSDVDLSPIIRRLEAIYKPRLVILDHQITSFHYTHSGHPANLEEAQIRLQSAPEKFFAPVSFVEAAGPGLYVDMDPYSSRAFGVVSPDLYLISIKAGSRLLNLKNPTPVETQEVLSIAKDLNCPALTPKQVEEFRGEDLIEALRGSKVEACQKVVSLAVENGEFEAILYDYHLPSRTNGGPVAVLKDCRNPRLESINIIRPRAIDFTKLAYVSNDQIFDPFNEMNFVGQLYTEAVGRKWISYKRPEKLPDADFDGAAYRSWKKTNIYNCD